MMDAVYHIPPQKKSGNAHFGVLSGLNAAREDKFPPYSTSPQLTLETLSGMPRATIFCSVSGMKQ